MFLCARQFMFIIQFGFTSLLNCSAEVCECSALCSCEWGLISAANLTNISVIINIRVLMIINQSQAWNKSSLSNSNGVKSGKFSFTFF